MTVAWNAFSMSQAAKLHVVFLQMSDNTSCWTQMQFCSVLSTTSSAIGMIARCELIHSSYRGGVCSNLQWSQRLATNILQHDNKTFTQARTPLVMHCGSAKKKKTLFLESSCDSALTQTIALNITKKYSLRCTSTYELISLSMLGVDKPC